MADDFLDFLPLYPDEDEDAIRARWEAWANEGITTADVDQWTDTREGAFWWVMTAGGIREAARIYDLMGTEVPMSGFALWAWGEYLDDLGLPYGLDRLPATPAAGVVRFTGPAGTAIPAGTGVAVTPVDLDVDAPEYQTTVTATIGGGGTVDVPVSADADGSAGNVAIGAVSVLVTPISGVTVSNPAPIVGGTDPEEDEAYRDRIMAAFKGQGGGNVQDYEKWARDFPGVGRATIIPLFAGPGTVLVVVMTATGDPVSQGTVDDLQRELDPPAFTTQLNGSVTLPAASIQVDSTTGARPTTGGGHIRIGDQLVSFASMDATHFLGCAGGTGTFPDNTLVTQSGRGGGVAPIGHVVVVKTAALLTVNISAIVEPESGYTLDGFGGTVALQDAIEAAITEYVERVEPGGEVVHNQVIGVITTVPGVHDVGSVTINGSAANLPVPGDPTPSSPAIGTITLTSGSV